jgi:hypothetical protein
MYRIEFEPGDVGVFRGVEEVATAIKSGVITARARIYHQASDKWLPIEFHPHYRKALEMVAKGPIPAPPSPAPAPAPVLAAFQAAIQAAQPEPAEPELSDPEPVAPEPIEPELEPVALAPEVVEPEMAESEPEPEPELEPETEPISVSPPPEFVFAAARSREIRFIPLEPPTPLSRTPLAHVFEAPPPAHAYESALPPAEPVVEPATEQHFTVMERGLHLSDPQDFGPEASGRPMFRPRFRLAISGNLRRPILLAIGGVALVLSTGLSVAASPWSAGLMSIPSLPFLSRESAAGRAAESLNEAQAGARLPGDAEPQGSPSFGASSAFPAASRAGSPTDPKRPGAIGTDVASAPAEKAEGHTDSIVRVAPQSREIAIAAPKIAGLPGASNSKLTPAVLVERYEAAYAAARAELETGFRTAGFANVFAPEHMSSAQGLRVARLSAGTASAYVAKYRRREAEIEAAYADSAEALAKSPADRGVWESRPVLRESPEVAKLASFLLGEVDSVFGVLASQDTAYAIKDGAITFQDAAAARAYGELRPWLDRNAHKWADTASGPPSTAARVLRAIGSTRLPEGGAF